MHIKSILPAVALALAATIGSASAAEQFSALEGITAAAMTPQELGAVVGGKKGASILNLSIPAAAIGKANARAATALAAATAAGKTTGGHPAAAAGIPPGVRAGKSGTTFD